MGATVRHKIIVICDGTIKTISGTAENLLSSCVTNHCEQILFADLYTVNTECTDHKYRLYRKHTYSSTDSTHKNYRTIEYR